MKTKEYRTWRLIILFFNILIHLSIFLSLTNFKIGNLEKRYPSYLEIAAFSEGKGISPNLAGSPIPKAKKVEQTDIQENKQPTDQQKILRSVAGGVVVFNDSVQNKSKADTLHHNVTGTEENANDTLNLHNILASQSGTGIGNGSGSGTNSDIQMPRFMNGDYNEFHNYVFKNYTLYTENFNGSVLVEFVINKNGEITDITITNCNNNKIKREIQRIIRSSPRWIPAKQRNRPVNLSFSLVFNFYGY